MVFEGIVDNVVDLVLLVGLPLLLVLFYLEGLVLGKLLQPPAVFVAVVAIIRPSWVVILALCVTCTIAVVAGQWTLFRSFDENAPRLFGLRDSIGWLDTLPETVLDRLGEKRFAFIDRLFVRYGAVAIIVSTFLPGIRGTLAIPAGMSSYPRHRFLTATGVANALYFPALVAVAFGLLRLLGVR